MLIQGVTAHSIRCTNVNNLEFKKDIVHVGNVTYHHYFLTEQGIYREPEEGETKKPRISDDTAVRVRNLLKNGTAQDVYEIAQSEGLQVSKRQCHNQLRHLREPSGSESVGRVVKKKKKEITMEQLDLLKTLFPDEVTLYRDDNNALNYEIRICASGKIDQTFQVEQTDYQYDGVEEFSYEDQMQDQIKEEPNEFIDGVPDISDSLMHYPKFDLDRL
ncbi:hypothetical protein GCK72_001264 [Caenorhabditis remanei]|uniref:Uncharacterized protein n=1 Tax=Caenorhabditis remanei TaxID=31234 RepID=A0A6A5HSY4_CAERE|nr:hypothetical protein GCK72_001264 [Caenorhabditis remanei]KAF1769447.1 hypothetical protein GCK72_001264 [Caenorhabditis remanei]